MGKVDITAEGQGIRIYRKVGCIIPLIGFQEQTFYLIRFSAENGISNDQY